MSEQKHRVWIELEQPKDEDDAEQIVAKANRMLERLRGASELAKVFGWDARRKQFTYGNDMGYENLVDRGQWFSLTYLGRPLEAS